MRISPIPLRTHLSMKSPRFPIASSAVCPLKSISVFFVNSFKFYPYRVLNRIAGDLCFVDFEVYKESLNNPVIIHYLGEERPWREGNANKFRGEYIKYANKTPWGYQVENGWYLYFIFWNIFNFVMIPFPMLRYKIINGLIPFAMKMRRNKINNKE